MGDVVVGVDGIVLMNMLGHDADTGAVFTRNVFRAGGAAVVLTTTSAGTVGAEIM